jgi:L-galactose dehydrogenase
LHDIEFVSKEQILNEAMPAIEKIKASGKARFIGISGLPVRYLAVIARQVELDTVLSWAHYNLLQDEINDELVPLSKEKKIGLMNAAPLLQRVLSDATIPDWHNAPKEILAVQPALLDICKKYGVRLSDVAMRYAMDHPGITTTIVGMNSLTNIQQNVASVDFKIPEGILKEMAEVIAPIKNLMWFEGQAENNIQRS